MIFQKKYFSEDPPCWEVQEMKFSLFVALPFKELNDCLNQIEIWKEQRGEEDFSKEFEI